MTIILTLLNTSRLIGALSIMTMTTIPTNA